MSRSNTTAFKHGLIWNLLLLDSFFLLLRYGGIAVVDLIIHGCFFWEPPCSCCYIAGFIPFLASIS